MGKININAHFLCFILLKIFFEQFAHFIKWEEQVLGVVDGEHES